MRMEAQAINLRRIVFLDLASANQSLAEVLSSAGRAGGMVSLAGCAEPPQSPFHVPEQSSLASVLDLLTAAHPDYFWSVQDGAIDLLPKAKASEVLSAHVRGFEWDTTAAVSLSMQRIFDLPEIRSVLSKTGMASGLEDGPGLQQPPRVLNGLPEPAPQGRKYEIRNTTVLAVLNAVATSYETAFWWYEERTCGGQTTYRLSARDLRRRNENVANAALTWPAACGSRPPDLPSALGRAPGHLSPNCPS
jgi:hypothetical protein